MRGFTKFSVNSGYHIINIFSSGGISPFGCFWHFAWVFGRRHWTHFGQWNNRWYYLFCWINFVHFPSHSFLGMTFHNNCKRQNKRSVSKMFREGRTRAQFQASWKENVGNSQIKDKNIVVQTGTSFLCNTGKTWFKKSVSYV